MHAGMRALDAVVNDVKEPCKGIPHSERIAPRRAKERTFNLIIALAFMANLLLHDQMIEVVKYYMPDVVSPQGPYVWEGVHKLLPQFTAFHKLWRQKAFFGDPEIFYYCQSVKQFAAG